MKKANLPTVLTISPMGENKMRDGKSVVDTCKELEQRGADVVGLNCFRGPATMMPFLKEIRKAVKCHLVLYQFLIEQMRNFQHSLICQIELTAVVPHLMEEHFLQLYFLQ